MTMWRCFKLRFVEKKDKVIFRFIHYRNELQSLDRPNNHLRPGPILGMKGKYDDVAMFQVEIRREEGQL